MSPFRPSRVRSTAAAFTLVEIMVVVAILGLTLTMGLPSFVKALKKEGMRKAQMDLLEACRTARRTSILTAQPVYLTFHPIDGTVEVPGQFQAKFPEDIVIDILGVNFVQLEHADLARVCFKPNGTSDEFTIVMHSGDGETVKVSLEPITALARLEPIR
ncbi:MAG TPA: type II secretion system protein [Verrucomicrobiae bacterium]|jgi:prepilin-type N-terminal cleavage/methylation domain-containing protein|nr:type II secretion system protein [Verrucomicrobiae bacterium]